MNAAQRPAHQPPPRRAAQDEFKDTVLFVKWDFVLLLYISSAGWRGGRLNSTAPVKTKTSARSPSLI